MLASLVNTLALISINFAGDSPEYDFSYYQSGGEEGSCQFSGTISTGGYACTKKTITRSDFKQNGDLTWSILTDVCPDLVRAGCADPDWDTDDQSMDDLLWIDCNNCPKCPCNQDDEPTYYINGYNRIPTYWSSGFEIQQCYECICSPFSKVIDGEYTIVNGSVCYKQTDDFNTVDELQRVECPYTTAAPTPAPTGGCDDNANNTYLPGQTFWYYDEKECETYCLCHSSNVPLCETGWENIINNEELKYPFLETCAYNLADAWNEPSRFVTPDNTTCTAGLINVGRCPTPDCSGHGGKWNGTEWKYATYNTDGSVEYVVYDCVDCECINSVPVCDAYDVEEQSPSLCSREQLVCSFDDDGNGQIDSTGDDMICDASGGDKYCGWQQFQLSSDPSLVCIESLIEQDAYWGCFADSLCDSFYGYSKLEGSDGVCTHQSTSFAAYSYDCINYKWLSETYKLTTDTMCCTNDNCVGHGCTCNEQEILTTLGDDVSCGSNSRLEDYLKTTYECFFGDRGISNNDFIKHIKCGVALPDTYEVCELISVYWQWTTYCQCKLYQILEKGYGNDDYYDGLRSDLELQFEEDYGNTRDEVEVWNQAYNCGLEFECDITDDAHKVSITVSFLFVGICYWL